MIVAVCGKGGVGKTTVSAVSALAMTRREGVKALMVDADPAAGLSMALAIKAERTLDDIRQDTVREIRDKRTDKEDVAVGIDFRLMDALTERGNLAFLSIGRPREEGCYCAVNSLLRDSIEVLAGRFDLTVIDAEAGIEQINRKVLRSIDYLLLVSDASAKGIRVARSIRDVACRWNARLKAGLLLNRVKNEDELRAAEAGTDLLILGRIPEDDTIRRFDARELSFFDLPSCPAADAVVKALEDARIL